MQDVQEERKPATPDDVWAILREISKSQKELAESQRELAESQRELAESQKETDRKFKETDRQMKETDRQMKETDRQLKETDRLVKELSKNIGGVNRSVGRFMEEVYSARIWDKFTELGYEFTTGCRNKKFKENRQTLAEVDIFLENGLYAMPVEIKVDLTMEDVDEHIERMATIRSYLDRHGDRRVLVGAIAGGIAPETVVNYAQKKGLYVVVWSGDAATVAEAPPIFKAREL
jgi:hypothetical protein